MPHAIHVRVHLYPDTYVMKILDFISDISVTDFPLNCHIPHSRENQSSPLQFPSLSHVAAGDWYVCERAVERE